jgi:hypothetical protein
LLDNLKTWFRWVGCLFGWHEWTKDGPAFWSRGALRQEYECPHCFSLQTRVIATKWSNDQ